MQDKINHFNQFTAKLITDFIKIYVPETKKLYKLKKDEKVKIISKYVYDNKLPLDLFEYVKPVRELREYGISKGVVKPYNEQEQSHFDLYYNESLTLQQKKLDEKKHKNQYNRNLKINIQDHQKRFILSFINDSLQGALLFHSVGSGKTLTSVIFSHYYLSLHPTHNVCIISPPSLLFNFIEALKEYGLDIRDNRYKFETFNKFCKNTDKYVNDKTLLIIDEVHYFRTFINQGRGEIKDPNTGKTKNDYGKNHNGDIIIQACKKAKKIICMTGTPFINTLYDIENIMSMIGKKQPLSETAFEKLLINDDNLKDYFNYRISYFNVMDTDTKRFFPIVNIKYIPIPIDSPEYERIYNNVAKGIALTDNLENTPHDNLIKKLMTVDNNEEDNEGTRDHASLVAYYNGSRQLSNFILYRKINYIIELIKKHPNENIIIYSIFMTICLSLIKGELIKHNIKYVSIDGDINTKKRQDNLNKFNDINSGINVLLISKAGTEGISTRRCRHIVICESNFNMASIEQAIARAVRFKSHEELPEKDRNVSVHRLMLCVNDKDLKIIDKFNDNSYNKQYFEIKENIDKKNLVILNMLKRASNVYSGTINIKYLEDKYYKVEHEIQSYNHKKSRGQIGKKKPPLHFEWTPSILLQYVIKDPIYKLKLSTDKIFVKHRDEYNNLKQVDETRENIERGSNSSDILLEIMALKKKTTIDNFIKRMYKSGENNVKTVEEFDEETTNKLITSYNSGKSMKYIINEQIEILKENKKTFIKLSNDIEEIILNDVKKHKKEKRSDDAVLQEYHTPLEISRELVKYSTKLNQENLRCLEPTAGFGSIVKALVENMKTNNYMIEMIEINDSSREILKAYQKTMPSNLKLEDSKDFLLYDSNEDYDLILMNPPFHIRKGENKNTKDVFDSDFVLKAYSMLKDDGEILCIVSNMLTHRKNWNKKIKIELLKTYTNYKWKGDKGKKLNLNFKMYRITKT